MFILRYSLLLLSTLIYSFAAPTYAATNNITHDIPSSINAGQNWLMNFKAPSGLFHYQYSPKENSFSNEDNLVRQIGSYQALIETSHFTKNRKKLLKTLSQFESALKTYKKETIIDGTEILYFEDKLGEASVNSTAYYLSALLAKNAQGITLTRDEKRDIEKSAQSLLKMDSGKGGLYYLYFMPAKDNIVTSFGTGAALNSLTAYAQYKNDKSVLKKTDQIFQQYLSRSQFFEKPFSDREVSGFTPHALLYFAQKSKTMPVDYNKNVRPLVKLIMNARTASSQCANNGCVTSNAYWDSPLFEGLAAAYPVIKKYETNHALLAKIENYLDRAAQDLITLQIQSIIHLEKEVHFKFTGKKEDITGAFCLFPICAQLRNEMTMHAISALTHYADHRLTEEVLKPITAIASLKNATNWLTNIQKKDGLFSYQYNRERETFDDDNNIVRQIGTFWSLIELQNYFQTDHLKKAIKNFQRGIKPYIKYATINDQSIAYIAHKGLSKINATALYILAYSRLKQNGITLSIEEENTLNQMVSGAFQMVSENKGFYYLYFVPQAQNRISVYGTGQMLYALQQYQAAFNVSFSTAQETILKNIYNARIKEMVNSPIIKENHRAFVLWALYLAHHHKNYKEIENIIKRLWTHKQQSDQCHNNTCLIENPDPALLEGVALIYPTLPAVQKNLLTPYLQDSFTSLFELQIKNNNMNENGAFCVDKTCKNLRIDITQHHILSILHFLKYLQ